MGTVNNESNAVSGALCPSALEGMREFMLDEGRAYWRYERVRLLGREKVWQDIAYPPPRCENLDNFVYEGHEFSIWLNWDGRAWVEGGGKKVLSFWAPAADLFSAIDHRKKARNAEGL